MKLNTGEIVEFNGKEYKVHFVGTEVYKVKNNGQHVHNDECFRLVAWRTMSNEETQRYETTKSTSAPVEVGETPVTSKL